jgi:hypothetical protein
MQTLLLMEIGQVLQSEQALKKLSVTKDGKEAFSESFSQEVMAITAGFVEMKIVEEEWDGKMYYIAAQITVDPKEVSQRIAETLNSKQQDNAPKVEKKEEVKAEQEKTEVEKKVQELEAQKKEIALKQELKRQQEIEAKQLARLEKELAKEKEKQEDMDKAKYAKGWYQPKALGLGGLFGYRFDGSVTYTRNISPNFGFDIFKLNGGGYWSNYEDMGYFQLLAGLRFATNCFGKNKRTYFYTSVRAGVGFFDHYKDDYTDYEGGYVSNNYYDSRYTYYYYYGSLAFAAELEAGFHFKYFFLGVAINQAFYKPDHIRDTYSSRKGDNYGTYTETKLGKGNLPMPLIGLRIGVDIGKSKPY